MLDSLTDEPIILRKMCSGCEAVAEPYEKNEFGNLGGWLYAAGGWWCRNCSPPREEPK